MIDFSFNEKDWVFERSSGYAGYRNVNQYSKQYDNWIFSNEFSDRSRFLNIFNNFKQFYKDFLKIEKSEEEFQELFLLFKKDGYTLYKTN